MIIDSKVETEPRAWLISKVNRISPNGICRVTLTQDNYDQHRDYIEKNEDGKIIGQWADYYKSNVIPEPVIIDDALPSSITATITCSGKPQFKIGGSAKTFTITYKNEEGEIIPDHEVGIWSLHIGEDQVANDLLTLSQDGAKLKVKFLGDDSYIGKILTITNTSEDAVANLDVEIVAL